MAAHPPPEPAPPSDKRATDLDYSDLLKEHLSNPRHAGEVSDPDAVAEQTNPVCGDRLRLSLRIDEGHIKEARFLAYGCPPTLACGSALAGTLEGLSLEAAAALDRADIIEAVGGLPSRKRHAAALAVETLRAALDSLRRGR